MAYASHSHANGISFADRLSALRERFAERRAQRALYRTTLRELNSLSNHELADLGLHRSGIRRVALEAAGIAK